MGQVNRIPSGFLDLLGAQSQGKTPPLYADVLGPVVDMGELYRGNALSMVVETLAHTTFGNTQDFTVPAGETWLLRAVSSDELLTSTGQFTQWAWSFLRPPRGATGGATIKETFIHVSPIKQILLANAWATDAHEFASPIAFQNGTIIRAKLAQRDAGVGRSSNLAIAITRLIN